MKVIGNNLKRLRELQNLSVEEVREYLRLGSVQAVYKYEAGKGYPPVDTMFALMELYGAELADIIYDHSNTITFIRKDGIQYVFTDYENSRIDIETQIIHLESYKERQKRYQKILNKYCYRKII